MRTTLAMVFLFYLAGCASQSSLTSRPAAEQAPTIAALLAQLRDWRGTPYQYGGNSRRGIDCSAFVQSTLSTRFDYTVPRTTRQQDDVGVQIKGRPLEAGDLVFFDIKRGGKHVGIYVSNGNFIHAGKSRGVTMSNLKEKYWAQRYRQARRLTGLKPASERL